MKVSYDWLNEYLDLDVEPRDLAEKIARTSVDINDVYSLSDGLKKLVVGEVETCEPHPDSDHLHVCSVNVGEEEPLQIVCGAPNVAAGQKVIVALNGARIARFAELNPTGCFVPYRRLVSVTALLQRLMKTAFTFCLMMLNRVNQYSATWEWMTRLLIPMLLLTVVIC